jgi:hypothetical protein
MHSDLCHERIAIFLGIGNQSTSRNMVNPSFPIVPLLDKHDGTVGDLLYAVAWRWESGLLDLVKIRIDRPLDGYT